jgi:hypothetical protein
MALPIVPPISLVASRYASTFGNSATPPARPKALTITANPTGPPGRNPLRDSHRGSRDRQRFDAGREAANGG